MKKETRANPKNKTMYLGSRRLSRRRTAVITPKAVIMWALLLIHCCDWAACENGFGDRDALISYDDDDTAVYNYQDQDDGEDWTIMARETSPFENWEMPPTDESAPGLGKESSETLHSERRRIYGLRKKRAAFGILALATKRPHKTAAQLQHLPRDDTFVSVRGKKGAAGFPTLSVRKGTLPRNPRYPNFPRRFG